MIRLQRTADRYYGLHDGQLSGKKKLNLKITYYTSEIKNVSRAGYRETERSRDFKTIVISHTSISGSDHSP